MGSMYDKKNEDKKGDKRKTRRQKPDWKKPIDKKTRRNNGIFTSLNGQKKTIRKKPPVIL